MTDAETIEHLREELRKLQWQYDERGAAMRETGEMVRSLFVPVIQRLRKVALNSDWSDQSVRLEVLNIISELAQITTL